MDFSEGHYGVALLNDCKYGYSVQGADLTISLIKSGIEPNPTTDQEEHFFTYSLYPHEGSLYDSDTIREGYRLNYPTYVVVDSEGGESASFVEVNRKNVIIETVKQAEDGDGVIVRLYECENAKTEVELSFGMGKVIEYIRECNLMEEAVGEELACEGNRVVFEVKAFEIRTFRVKLC
jgi:alpha-mannosidase